MTLREILAHAGVQHAHIIDDAYDEAPSVPPDAGVAQNFIDALEVADLERLYKLLGLEISGGEVMVEALSTPENLFNLFTARETFAPHIDLLFGEYLSEREAKLKQITPLVNFLQQRGVQCHTFGADYQVEGSVVPQLVFIDLRLREKGPVQVDDAVQAYKKLRRSHNLCHPFVFLISSLPTKLADRREEFREQAELFASEFESMEKSFFNDDQELETLLARYIRVLPQLHKLHEHIEGLGEALQNAAKKVQNAVRALDLADYFVLHHNTVSIEQVRLGTYISDLLLEYVAYEVEGTQSIWDFAKDLDEWKLEDLPRSRFALTPAAARIYTGNVLHSKVRLDQELGRNLGPVEGYFYLGDIFCEAKELNEAKLTRALVIATPACDLVRPEKLKERTIFLCEGKIKTATKASVPALIDGVATVVMPHPTVADTQLLIEWNKKRLHTWHAEDMDKFTNPQDCHWVRVARLRPLYAVQLQHAITADLGRIGVQRAPNVLIPHGVEVLIRGEGKWISLDSEDRGEATAAALADNGERKKQTVFIIADASVRRIRRKLVNWLDSNPHAQAVAVLRKLLALPDFDQRLMYLAHQVPPDTADGQNVDITGYPFQAVAGLEGVEMQAVAFVRPATPSRYLGIAGGQAVNELQCASLVVKFIRVG